MNTDAHRSEENSHRFLRGHFFSFDFGLHKGKNARVKNPCYFIGVYPCPIGG
jgi:hypothetical protein